MNEYVNQGMNGISEQNLDHQSSIKAKTLMISSSIQNLQNPDYLYEDVCIRRV